MRPATATLLFLSLLAGGCASQGDPFSAWRMDNPRVRKIQAEETAKHVPDAEARKRLKLSIGKFVAMIRQDEKDGRKATYPPRTANGRAVAITGDGYYLTACHVVEDQPFSLYQRIARLGPETGAGKSSRPRIRFEDKAYPGRLVWSDPELDLALLKFERGGVPHFQRMRMPVAKGETVYSADDEGWGVVPTPGRDGTFNLRDMVGNGSFFVAGKIVSAEHRGGELNGTGYGTSLVARGAMSGGPLVSTGNELCGILVEGRLTWEWKWFRRPGMVARTYATMVDPAFITEKIREDRRRNRRRKPPGVKRKRRA